MKKIIFLACLLSFSAFAAELVEPQEVLGAGEYDMKICLDKFTDECIETCSQSSERDCPDNCAELAKDKCPPTAP